MLKIKRTVDIKAPVQRVYDYLNQPTNLPGIWPNMVSVSNVTPGAGGANEFEWTFKMAGVHFTGRTKVEEAQSGRYARFRNEGGIASTFVWTYAGLNGNNTRLTVELEYAIPAPVIGRVAEAVVAKINERDLDTMLSNLKDVMEHVSVSPAATARR